MYEREKGRLQPHRKGYWMQWTTRKLSPPLNSGIIPATHVYSVKIKEISMSDNQVPVYRKALKDSQHPMHQAAWYLFREEMSVERVASRLDDKKDEVVEFVRTLFRHRELYEPGSLGDGAVPYNCVDLMAHWQAESFIPELIPALMYTDERFFENDLDFVFDRVMRSLSHDYGSAVVEPVLEALEQDDITLGLASDILSHACREDERCYQVIRKAFDRAEDPDDVEMYSLNLMRWDTERGRAALQERVDAGNDSEEVQDKLHRVLQNYI
jgi:hypothetical protein